MKKSNIAILILSIIIAVGIGFFGGVKYSELQKTQQRNTAGQRFPQRNTNGSANGQQAMRPVYGEILSLDESTMTVKMTDDSSKIVVLSGSTTYTKSETVDKTGLSVGTKVNVIGATNSNGTVTAESVQINPVMRNFNGNQEN